MRRLIIALVLGLAVLCGQQPARAQSLTDVPLVLAGLGMIGAWHWIHSPPTLQMAMNKPSIPQSYKDAALAQNLNKLFQVVYFHKPPFQGLWGQCPSTGWWFPNSNEFHPDITGPYTANNLSGWRAVQTANLFNELSGCRAEINQQA
jgi:hypothetical protein